MKIKTGLRLYKRFIEPVAWPIVSKINAFRVRNKTKIFCVGLNKTGTTSLESALRELGVIMVDQTRAELLFDDWVKRDFKRLFKLCRTAQGFQDMPFSFPETYKFLDREFPNSKFILTIRDSAEQWYNSLIRFHSRIYANGKRIPNETDLENAIHITKGRPQKYKRLVYKTPSNDPYNKTIMLKFYNDHFKNVVNYFSENEDKLLIINVSQKYSYLELCKFIGLKPLRENFEWKNRTN